MSFNTGIFGREEYKECSVVYLTVYMSVYVWAIIQDFAHVGERVEQS